MCVLIVLVIIGMVVVLVTVTVVIASVLIGMVVMLVTVIVLVLMAMIIGMVVVFVAIAMIFMLVIPMIHRLERPTLAPQILIEILDTADDRLAERLVVLELERRRRRLRKSSGNLAGSGYRKTG